jgi:UTP--glucose-1-phosphate uridylyltransferase
MLIILCAGKDSIINDFDKNALDETMDDYGFRNLPDIYFVRQKEQRGLADAVRCAEHFTGDSDFVVLLGDTIYKSGISKTVTSQILDIYKGVEKPLMAVEKVPREKVSDNGIVDQVNAQDEPITIRGVVEKPEPESAPSDLGITGIYILGTYVYDYISQLKP